MITKFTLLIVLFLMNSYNGGRHTVITNLTTCDYYYHAITEYGIYDVKIPSKYELIITAEDTSPIRIILEVRDSCIPDCDTTYIKLINSDGIHRIEGDDGDTYQDLILHANLRQYFILPPKCHKI